MKQVWQCTYCCKTTERKKDMKKHEKVCSANPKNRQCYSCGAREQRYGIDECTVGGMTHHSTDNDEPCELWIPEKE